MGRVRRFSRLDQALKDGAAKTGIVMQKYLATKPGGGAAPNNIKKTAKGSEQQKQINPFGFPEAPPLATSAPLRTTMSKRAADFLAAGTLGATAANMGLDDLASTTKSNGGFISAKMICGQKLAQAVPVPSGYYTTLPYKKTIDGTYTFPFGAIAAFRNQFAQQANLLKQVDATKFTVSFQPERLYA